MVTHCPLYKVYIQAHRAQNKLALGPLSPQPISTEHSGLCLGLSLCLDHPSLFRELFSQENSSNPSSSGPLWGLPIPELLSPSARVFQLVHEAHCPVRGYSRQPPGPLLGLTYAQRPGLLTMIQQLLDMSGGHRLPGIDDFHLTWSQVRACEWSGVLVWLPGLSPHHGPPQMSLALLWTSVFLSVS